MAEAIRLSDAHLTSIIVSSAAQMIFVLSSHLRRVFDIDVNESEFVERLADALVMLIFIENYKDMA